MTGRISRYRFGEKLDGDNLRLDQLEQDPRSRGVDLRAADLDGDGVICDRAEHHALARIVDGLDGRTDGWVTLTRRGGSATPVVPIVQAIAAREAAPDLTMTVDEITPSMARAVVLVGMSETAYAEAAALRHRTPVVLVTDARNDRPEPPLRMTTAAEVTAYVATLGLREPQRQAVVEVLLRAPESGRSELAQLAATWAPGERGEVIPGRLLLSGHGDGEQLFGDDHDALRAEDIQALARAMPRAAAQIDALHIGACQHGYAPRIEGWVAAFPNVRSVWAYAGFSSSGSAAYRQQATWERATRDPSHGAGDLSPRLARGTRRGENVAVWTRDGGYAGPAQRDMAVILADLERTDGEYRRFATGELDVEDPRAGPVWQRYQWLQDVVNHSDFRDQPEGFRRWARTEMDHALRLRFFAPHVTRAFDRAYARAIESGYRALGSAPPRFEGMSRREVLAEVDRFRRALAARPDAPAAAHELERLLVEGLVELRASRVPSEWV